MPSVAKLINIIHGQKPTMIMVMIQMSLAGVNVCYKLASNNGMSMRIMVAYRHMFAAATVVPLALCFERKSRPKLTWMILFQAFLCALFGGSLAQNFYAQSLVMTSATFVSAMANLVPALTFIMAVFFRLERFELKTMAGKAKVFGTLMGIGGAMLLTFYKGIEIKIWPSHFELVSGKNNIHSGHFANSQRDIVNHVLGPILAIVSCFSWAISLILQAKMSQSYPCHYSSTALISLMGSIQAVVFALCMERRWIEWKLGWNIRLLSAAYSGAIVSGIMVIFTMWCVRMRGPLFVSIFNPLLLILVAIAGSLFLNEKLHLGSVLGAMVIICGLYSVLWGKGKEMKRIVQLVPSRSFGNSNDEQLDHGMAEANIKTLNISSGAAPNIHLPPSSEVDALNNDEDLEEGNNISNIAKS